MTTSFFVTVTTSYLYRMFCVVVWWHACVYFLLLWLLEPCWCHVCMHTLGLTPSILIRHYIVLCCAGKLVDLSSGVYTKKMIMRLYEFGEEAVREQLLTELSGQVRRLVRGTCVGIL